MFSSPLTESLEEIQNKNGQNRPVQDLFLRAYILQKNRGGEISDLSPDSS